MHVAAAHSSQGLTRPHVPAQIKLHHIVQLGSLGLDCVMLGALDMGRVGHSVCATLATLAHNHDCAAMMVGAVDGASDEGVLRSVLALAEVDEEELGGGWRQRHGGGTAA